MLPCSPVGGIPPKVENPPLRDSTQTRTLSRVALTLQEEPGFRRMPIIRAREFFIPHFIPHFFYSAFYSAFFLIPRFIPHFFVVARARIIGIRRNSGSSRFNTSVLQTNYKLTTGLCSKQTRNRTVSTCNYSLQLPTTVTSVTKALTNFFRQFKRIDDGENQNYLQG